MFNSSAELDLKGSVLFGIHQSVSFALYLMVPLFKPWQLRPLYLHVVETAEKKICSRWKLSKHYFCKQHLKSNCLGLCSTGTNNNRKADLNVASSSFFQLKKSAMGHLISHCHWAAELGQLKSQNNFSLLGMSKEQESTDHKGELSSPVWWAGNPSRLWVSVKRQGRKDSSRLQWNLSCVKHISPLGKQLLSLLLQVKMVAKCDFART